MQFLIDCSLCLYSNLTIQCFTDDYNYTILGHCVVHAERDLCGLNSVPILCDNEFNSLSCLCDTGTKSSENSTCLGEEENSCTVQS